MDDSLYQVFLAALGAMGDSETARGPKPLFATMQSLANIDEVSLESSDEQALWDSVTAVNPNEPVQLELGRLLRRWDTFEQAAWINGTSSHTEERRALVYQKLGVPDALVESLGQIFPMAKPPPSCVAPAVQRKA